MALAAINLADVAAGTGGFVIHGQDAGDQAGFSVSSAGDINGDGFDDLIIGARNGDAAGDGTYNAGDSYVVFGMSGGFGAAIDLAAVASGAGGFVIHGLDVEDYSGFSVSSAGDVNGDGFDDLVIGAPYADGAGNATSRAGDSYVVFGKSGGFAAALDLATIAGGTGGFVIHGVDAFDGSGQAVSSAGDVNGDGFDDLIIGAFKGDAADDAKNYAGDSYVIFGKASGFDAEIDLAAIAGGTGGFVIHGEDAFDRAGASVSSAGDVNGDGFDDLIIGAPYADGADDATSYAGDSYVVFGTGDGFGASVDLAAVALGTGGFVIRGQGNSDSAGASVSSAGDVNGDGFGDLIIGARYGDGAGDAESGTGDSYVVFGKAGGFDAEIDLDTIALGTGGFVIRGEDAYDQSGVSVSSAGDMNGDGFDDLVIGARYASGAGNATSGAGASYVVFGHAGGFGAEIDLADIAAGNGGFVIHGEDANDRSGFAVSSAGDVDGDGFDDLIIGAHSAGAAGNLKAQAGGSYVVFGRDFLGTVTHAGTSAAETLTGTAAADDMVGGQGNDIVIGNGGADVLVGGAGDDTLRVSDLSFARAMGGSGTDTLALDGAGITLDLAAIANSKLQDIERIDLTGSGDNGLVLSQLEVLNLSSTSNTLVVDGDAGDAVDIGTGWTLGSPSGGRAVYTQGAARLEIDTDLSVACFAAGTRIRTARGEMAVEMLTDGDRVVTASGELRAVRWIGHRSLAPARHPRPWDVQPIRVDAGAFGPGLPARPLRLSPDHAVFTAGVLIPIRYLLNGATVVQEAVDQVTYYHVELADAAGMAVHDVLLAEGMPCESFLDTGNRAAFANGGAAVMLHAEFALQMWEARACADLVFDGPTLDATRSALLACAAALGHATTTDPDLHVLADGAEIRPVWDGDEAMFEVPASASRLRLGSRTMVPGHFYPGNTDMRVLGVAVSRLAIGGVDVALDDAALSAGWHAAETALRWTGGMAALPNAAGKTITVTVVPLLRYWQHPPAARPVPSGSRFLSLK